MGKEVWQGARRWPQVVSPTLQSFQIFQNGLSLGFRKLGRVGVSGGTFAAQLGVEKLTLVRCFVGPVG